MDKKSSRITPEDILQEAQLLLQQTQDVNENKGILTVRSANKWIDQAKNRPKPEMLFDMFWYEGELCILFADTNLGKSILAVQIGDSISKGISIKGFKLSAKKQHVLYLDFELSDKQFEIRYLNESNEHYSFSDDFKRVEINPDVIPPDDFSFEDYLIVSLEQIIIDTEAKVIIIDNITYLKTENEKAKDALPLMKQLKALKRKYGLSILALAHTPKRDFSKPLTKNDLQGSKMLINFCDSAFTIGQSVKDTNFRYIKQIKQRNSEEVYGSENVIICQIEKPDTFLKFEFVAFGDEREHLKQITNSDRENNIQAAKALSASGRSQREISTELGISVGAVNKYLKL